MKHALPLAIALCLAPAAFAAEIHVSPQGSDTAGDGSAQKPFATLEKARDAARRAPDAATVLLHDGVYRLAQPFRLDARDSGKGGGKTVYAAAPGAHPVLTGAKVVTGWTPETPEPGIAAGLFKAQVGKEVFRQLCVDGAWAPRASGPYIRVAKTDTKARTLALAAKDWPAAFGQGVPAGLELAVHIHWRHLSVHCVSAQVKDDKVTLTLPEAEQAMSAKPFFPGKGDTCRLENALALVDEPGEWFHDPADGTLRLMPPKGADPAKAQVEVPVQETLVQVTGTPEAPVKDLEFRGLTLTGTGWAKPSKDGVYATQFAQPYSGPLTVPAAFMAKHTVRLAFRDGKVAGVGGNGLVIDGAEAAAIAGTTFRDIGCNAIEGRRAVKDAAIWNNDISRCGQDITNGGGILLRNPTSGARIEHNHVHDMPYSGMQVGDQPGGYADRGTHHNLVRRNHVHHCMGLHDDGGGIYTLGGQQRGTEIAFNFIHDIRRSPLAGSYPVDGVYLDNYTQFIHVHHNVIRDCTVAAKEQNHSKDNVIEANVEHDEAIEKAAGVKAGFDPGGR